MGFIGFDANAICMSAGLEILTGQPIVVALCCLLVSCHSQPNSLHLSKYSNLIIVDQACLSVTLVLSFIFRQHL